MLLKNQQLQSWISCRQLNKVHILRASRTPKSPAKRWEYSIELCFLLVCEWLRNLQLNGVNAHNWRGRVEFYSTMLLLATTVTQKFTGRYPLPQHVLNLIKSIFTEYVLVIRTMPWNKILHLWTQSEALREVLANMQVFCACKFYCLTCKMKETEKHVTNDHSPSFRKPSIKRLHKLWAV